MSWSKTAAAALLSVSLLAPSGVAFAQEKRADDAASTTAVGSAPTPAPVWLRPAPPAIDSRPIVLVPVSAPRTSPFAPIPKPIVSEGAKAGLIAGAIVVGALIVTGVIIIHH